MLKKSAAALAVIMVVGAAQGAFAVQSSNAGISTVSGVTVSVADAVSAAEAKGQGKVVELALAGTPSQPVYNVTVQKPDGTEGNYVVNAKTGAIALSTDVADNQGNAAEQGEQEDGGADTGESGEGSSN